MNIKRLIALTVFTCCFTFLGNAQKEEVCYNPNLVTDTSKKSIKSMAFSKVNNDSIIIKYHSPGVRKRVIWGGLVPYDEVWVTGAHDATTIEFKNPMIIKGTTLPAGKYAFFTIPGKREWTIIINKRWEQHLASEYDAQQDIVRIKVKPKKNKHTERLQYFIEMGKDNNVTVSMTWEKVRIELPVKLL